MGMEGAPLPPLESPQELPPLEPPQQLDETLVTEAPSLPEWRLGDRAESFDLNETQLEVDIRNDTARLVSDIERLGPDNPETQELVNAWKNKWDLETQGSDRNPYNPRASIYLNLQVARIHETLGRIEDAVEELGDLLGRIAQIDPIRRQRISEIEDKAVHNYYRLSDILEARG